MTKVDDAVRNDVRVGDIMSFVYYGRVTDVSYNKIELQNIDDENDTLYVVGQQFINDSSSADKYNEVKRITKTHAAELIVNSHGKPFTVVFVKKNGQQRKMRARLVNPEPLLGRSIVEDLDLSPVDRVRQVDHRTLVSLIIDNVKYMVVQHDHKD